MILLVLLALFLAFLRVVAEVIFEWSLPRRTTSLFLVFVLIALYALTNL